MPLRFGWTTALGLAALLTLSIPVQAQPDTSFVYLTQGQSLGVGALLQTDVDVARPDRNDGFRVRVARLRFGGTAEPVDYFVQVELAGSPSLLDLRLAVPLTPRLRLTTGLLGAPFSQEFLDFRGALLLAERARVINALAPQRQVGATLSATLVPRCLTLDVGAYNGNGRAPFNDNDHLLYVGRLNGTVPLGSGTLRVAGQAAVSEDQDVTIPMTAPNFRGRRFVFGVDATLDVGRWEAAVEAIAADLGAAGAARDLMPSGLSVTGAVDLSPAHQLVARFDQFSPDTGPAGASARYIAGYTFTASDLVQAQANVVVPGERVEDTFATLRLQVALR